MADTDRIRALEHRVAELEAALHASNLRANTTVDKVNELIEHYNRSATAHNALVGLVNRTRSQTITLVQKETLFATAAKWLHKHWSKRHV